MNITNQFFERKTVTMKNITKALVLALSLVLLVGSVIGISVAAEEVTDSTAAILAQSIVHKDKIQIAFAVDATADEVKAGDVTVEYYLDGDTDNKKTATLYSDGTYNGKPVLVTSGFAAQDLTSVVTATSYLNGVAKETKTYSVAQFLLTKLYKDVDLVDTKYIELYESLIAYSAKAQAVFEPEEISINDHYIVWTENAEYDGETVVLCNSETTLDLSKAVADTVENYTFKDKWNVSIDGTEAKYATDATVTVSANTEIKPVMEIASGTGKYFNDESVQGIKLDFSKESDLDAFTYNYSASINTPAVAIDEDGVMHSNATANWQGFAIESGDTNKYSSGIYVFEADMCYDKVINQHSDGGNVFLGFQVASVDNVNNTNFFEFGRIAVEPTKTKYNFMNDGDYSESEPVFEIGLRYNIRVEYDITTGVSSIYVNGVLVDQNTAGMQAAANADSVNGVTTDYGLVNNTFGDFCFIWRRAGEISFDNIFYGVINGVVAE